MDKTLEGKVALISGGARGVGAAEARLFVESGARVVIGDVLDDVGAATAEGLGTAANYCHLDVSDPDSWQAAVATAVEVFGTLDVLVNNAGVFELGTIESTTLDSYQRLVAVNQTGTFLGMQAGARALRAGGGGAIVNTASAAGLIGTAGLFAYNATKWAIRGMTKTAALELGPDGIRVNVVLPGSLDTDMTRGQATAGREAFFASLPVPRQGQPDDVARVVAFLASDDAAYCTGAEIVVDGGLSAGNPLPPRRDQ